MGWFSKKDDGFFLSTVMPPPEVVRIEQMLGVVHGEAIIGANIFRDLFSSVRDVVGGRNPGVVVSSGAPGGIRTASGALVCRDGAIASGFLILGSRGALSPRQVPRRLRHGQRRPAG